MNSAYCLAMAVDCDDRASEAPEGQRQEWLLMAAEWRIAGTMPSEIEVLELA